MIKRDVIVIRSAIAVLALPAVIVWTLVGIQRGVVAFCEALYEGISIFRNGWKEAAT